MDITKQLDYVFNQIKMHSEFDENGKYIGKGFIGEQEIQEEEPVIPFKVYEHKPRTMADIREENKKMEESGLEGTIFGDSNEVDGFID